MMRNRRRALANSGVTDVTCVTPDQNASISAEFVESRNVTPSDPQGVTGVTDDKAEEALSPPPGPVIARPAVVQREALLDAEIGALWWSRRGRRYRRSR